MSSPTNTNSKLHVLLIGVDYYRPGVVGGVSYPSLRGSVRDISLVEDFFRRRLEVPPNRIRKLTASAPAAGQTGPPEPPADLPTYWNLVAAFQQLAADAAPGDLVYIHYSGHGGRCPTRWPDLKPGGLDESLVPYDISDPNSQYLRDVELSHLLRSMTTKGLFVTLVLDCCHSGGVTRGKGADATDDVGVRGVDFVDRTHRPSESLIGGDAELASSWREQAAKVPEATRGLVSGAGWVPGASDYVLLAACREHEFAYEFRFEGEHRNGALTYWLLDALRGLRPGLSYQALYDRLLAKVHTQFEKQTPLLLGPAARAFLGTETLAVRPASVVLKMDGRRVLIQTGQAVGVRAGARFALYPRDAVGEEARAVLAEVVEIGAAQSWAVVADGYDPATIADGDAAILLGAATLRRKVRLGAGPRLDAVRRALPKPDEGWIEEAGPNDPADFHVSLDSATDCLVIGDAAAHPLPNLPPLPADDREAGRVVRRLEHLARYRAVEEIENHDEDSLLAGNLVVELLGKQEKYQKGDERKPKPFPAGVPELNPGEWTFLRIRNTSTVSLNVAALNLEPGWGVSPVFPKSGLDRSFETIEPGKERCLDLQASIPDGIEEGPDGIKVFGAVGTADFRSLALPSLRDAEGGATRSARGDAAVTASRGGKPPGVLDSLFARLTDDHPTRALTAGATPSEEWTVTSVTFRVRRPGPSFSPQTAPPISEVPSVTAKTAPLFFPDIPVLGSRSPEEVAEALRAMGDPDAARALPPPEEGTRGSLGAIFGWGEPKAWQHTAHQLGFIAPGPVNSLAPLPIVYPGVIAADPTLKDSRVNIHLDRLRVEEYPGGGEHVVMITFRAQNQLPSNSGEPVSFSQVYRVRAGQTAPVTGYPLCIGLGVGKVGAAFQFFTVNVKDSADEATVGVLESSAFTGGLNLLTTAQPALKLLTDLTLGIAKQFATRNRNRPVQDYYLGLDFAPAAFGARLAVGNYLVVQVPKEDTISWEEWEYHPGNGLILNKAGRQPLRYNYLSFRVSKFEG